MTEQKQYKCERDKVLDEAINRIDLLEYARDPTVGAVVPFAAVIKVLEELRSKQEREQR